MKKFLLIASIILLLVFVTTNLLSIAFNIMKDAYAVETSFNSFSVSFLFENYLPQESYYDGPQNNPSPLIEPFKMLLLGGGLIFFSRIGRKTFKR